MAATTFLALVALLPVAAYALALGWRRVAWDTRAAPANLLRVGAGVLFAAWVHPALGLLAAVSGFWWLREGWPRLSGGTFWPLVAMALSLGLQAPAVALTLTGVILLTVGVLEVLVGVLQACGAPLLRGFTILGGQPGVLGTLGHRTGYGCFLALLIPLGFATPYGWPLAALYGIGVALSRSAVAAGAALVGLLVTLPALWPALGAGGLAAGVVAVRALEPYPAAFPWVKSRHVGDSWRARLNIWGFVLTRLRRWPAWLVGYGAHILPVHTRQWKTRRDFQEHYREAHNDYLEFAYEYGTVGLVAAGLMAWTVAPALRLGDPVTGSLAGLGTAMLAYFPMRVAPLAGVGLLLLVVLLRRAAA